MKTVLALLFLPLTVLANETQIAALYGTWKSKNHQEIEYQLNYPPSDAKCYKGGKWATGNERADPAYLAWKDMQNRIKLFEFFRDDRWGDQKALWPTVCPPDQNGWQCPLDRSDLTRWAKDNLRKLSGEYPTDWPPPEQWTPKGNVDAAGRATDSKGEVSVKAYGPNYVKYFWFPLALGLVFSLYAASKGGPSTVVFVGTVAVYGYLTSPMDVLGCFMGVYVVACLVVVMLFKMMLLGLGIGKK